EKDAGGAGSSAEVEMLPWSDVVESLGDHHTLRRKVLTALLRVIPHGIEDPTLLRLIEIEQSIWGIPRARVPLFYRRGGPIQTALLGLFLADAKIRGKFLQNRIKGI